MAARSVAARLAIIISGLVVGASATSAQTVPVAQKAAPARQPTIVHAVVEDAGSHQAMFSMRADLRRLVVAQETYWRARKTYASDVSGLPLYQETPGVSIQIIRARADGWTARATYGDVASGLRSCVVWVGDIPSGERPLTEAERKSYPEAEASCDGDGFTTKGEWAAAGRSYMTYALNRLARSESRFFAFHERFTNDPSTLDPFILGPRRRGDDHDCDPHRLGGARHVRGEPQQELRRMARNRGYPGRTLDDRPRRSDRRRPRLL